MTDRIAFSARDAMRFSEKWTLAGDCWQWTAAVDVHGYGRFRHDGRMKLAHRAAYEGLVGTVPAGLDLDHLCRNRACVNPDHLEPVTRSENLSRSPLMARGQEKTHCPRGHGYTPENTRITTRGARACRACENARNREKARAGVYNPPTPCAACGAVLRKGNLQKHRRAFHPDIAAALGIKAVDHD